MDFFGESNKMKIELAESILQNVMKNCWTTGELSEELKDIQIISEIKYDDYQQYTHGMRYVESLALWLRQFVNIDDRVTAYEFIKKKLVYVSQDEMYQLVDYAFPMLMKQFLIKKTKIICKNNNINDKQVRSQIYDYIMRSSLFLGLSDGAHMDFFRRQNPMLSNEQVFVHYDFSDKKAEDMLYELEKDLKKYSDKLQNMLGNKFKQIFLIDDFSASGRSYIRKDNEGWHGKIHKFYKHLSENFDYIEGEIDIHIILYISTNHAINYIKTKVEEYLKDKTEVSVHVTVDAVQIINPLNMNEETMIEDLLKKHYKENSKDGKMEYVDKHFIVGDCEYPYHGFSNGSLPLVIYHNTPNNSFPIIWFANNDMNALFPRVTRHKEV